MQRDRTHVNRTECPLSKRHSLAFAPLAASVRKAMTSLVLADRLLQVGCLVDGGESIGLYLRGS